MEDEEEPEEMQVKDQEEEAEEEKTEEDKVTEEKDDMGASVRAAKNARGARWTSQRRRSSAHQMEPLARSTGVAHQRTL